MRSQHSGEASVRIVCSMRSELISQTLCFTLHVIHSLVKHGDYIIFYR